MFALKSFRFPNSPCGPGRLQKEIENKKGANVQTTFMDVKIKVGPRSAHVGPSELSPERLEPYDFGYRHFSWVNFVHMQRLNLITLSLIPLLYILFRIKCYKAFTLA